MNRPLTALFAALEALLVVGIGIGIPLVPLTLLWAFQYGLQLDWVLFWRTSVDVWLLGHGADVSFTLDRATAASTGLAGAGDMFVVTIAPLGFALVTALLGVRAGRRIGETPHRYLGQLVAVAFFAVLALGAALTAGDPAARPSIVQGTLFPTIVFALGVAIGAELSRRRLRDPDDARRGIREWIEHNQPRLGRSLGAVFGRPQLRRAASVALTGGAAATALVLAISSLAVAVLLALNYGQVIALFEGVQSGILGGATLTVAQLALLPNLVIWAAAWFVGPGFGIGTGSAVSPLGTALGPVPAVPMLGALPTGNWTYGFVGLLVPVLAAFLTAVVLRPRLVRAGLTTPAWLVGSGVGMGLAGGVLLGALAWISGGAAGPGRLADVGPDWLLVGLWAALEIALPAVIALFVGNLRGIRWRPGRGISGGTSGGVE